MNDKIYLTRQDDTLRYRAIAQRTLAQDTVCVSIYVALLVSAAFDPTDCSRITIPSSASITSANPPSTVPPNSTAAAVASSRIRESFIRMIRPGG